MVHPPNNHMVHPAIGHPPSRTSNTRNSHYRRDRARQARHNTRPHQENVKVLTSHRQIIMITVHGILITVLINNLYRVECLIFPAI